MTIVQICGCIASDGDVTPFVSNQKAQFYGLYHSLPDGRFEWTGDFNTLEDVRQAADNGVKYGGYTLEDKTFDEEQS